jgi:transposase-like protein
VLGLSYGKIRRWLRDVLGLVISRGGLAQMVQRVAGYLGAAYELLRGELRQADYLHADETGWRVDGVNHWLWAWVNDEIAVYTIERSRGSDVLKQILGASGHTILISDFYSAYNPIVTPKQKCLVHLLREMHEARARDPTPEVESFAAVFKQLVMDAVGLKAQFDTLASTPYARRAAGLHERLDDLINQPWHDSDCRRWAKRLRRHREEILLFLEHRDVSWHNNEAERAIRPHVVIRKMCGGNRSARGAEAHSIILSVVETCRRRSVDFFTYARAAIERTLNGQPAQLPGG